MDIESEYRHLEKGYESFLAEIQRTIESFLADNNIPLAFNVSGRKKSLDSITEKIETKRFVPEYSITELNDLVGIRVVLLFSDSVKSVVDILKNEFLVIQESYENEQVDKFGYNSKHLVIQIKPEWETAPSFRGHANKKIEIQIRTIAQHVWAATSHTLFYKREENTPKKIQRGFNRLSALLEIVDESLQNYKNAVEEHNNYISTCPYDDILKEDLYPATFMRVMVENSHGLYNLNEIENKILSSQIEQDQNILTTALLDDIINNKINLDGINTNDYINEVKKLISKYNEDLRKSQSK